MNRTEQPTRKALRRKPVIAGGLLALFLFVLAMAQFRTLHRFCHAEAEHAGHQCVVCTLKAGMVDAPTVRVVVTPPPTITVREQITGIIFVSSADRTLLPSRGPPACFA